MKEEIRERSFQILKKKLTRLKNKRLKELEDLPDYSLKLFRIRKNECLSLCDRFEELLKSELHQEPKTEVDNG